MIKGTTPTHTFRLPVTAENVKVLKITYSQDNLVRIVKRMNDCTLNGSTARVKLTQEETLSLNHHKSVEIQIRILTVSGDALASNVKSVPCGRCLDTEVLT